MFTGIIEETGRVVAFTEGPDSWRLQVAAKLAPSDVKLGDSIAVNGCCLTVAQFNHESSGTILEFDLLRETWERTNLQQVKPGALVNIERSGG